MDLRFTEEEDRFRQEVRDFLKEELPDRAFRLGGAGEENPDVAWQFARSFDKKLAGKGWLTMAWPREYGGQGRNVIEQLVYNEEMSYYGAPSANSMGANFIGPTIMIYGNEAQKNDYLPKISRGEIVFCQGFSEPNSGSDLASLQTRAVEDGDDYVINGEKIWTSHGHRADFIWLGTRTDPNVPKHRGISTFIVPMKTPGVKVIPIINMAGTHIFNQTLFQDVRVSKDYLVGEKNRGWYQMATTLDFERSGVGRFAGARRTVEELIRFAKETKQNGRALADDPFVRNRLAQLAVEVEVGRMMAYKVGWMQSAGLVPNAEASTSKLFGSELSQRVAQLGIELVGMYGQLERGSKWAPLSGALTRSYLGSFSATIGGGTSEIQRNIIATRGLGLPR